MSLPWVRKQIEEKLGFSPYLGTLNIKLTNRSASQLYLLEKTPAIKIIPAEGYCIGLSFKARIENKDCAIILPKIENYPKNVLEIVAPLNLRETLNLKDGNMISVTVQT